MDISIGIVAYNALGKLRACLASLAAQQTPRQVETVVVDNASVEPVAEAVREEFPWVRLLANSDNRGFAGGTNQAVNEGTGSYRLWLNPDTVLPSPETLEQLASRLDQEPEVGALGCRLELPDGSTQPVSGDAPRVWRELFDLAHLPVPARRAEPTGTDLQRVEYICGACLLTRAEVWQATGGLDEGYFMYLEDVDWCRRVRNLGWQVAIAPDITVEHHEGSSFGGRTFARREHYYRSLVRYVRLHHGPPATALLRCGLAVTSLPKLLVALLNEWGTNRPARLSLLQTQLRLGLWGA